MNREKPQSAGSSAHQPLLRRSVVLGGIAAVGLAGLGGAYLSLRRSAVQTDRREPQRVSLRLKWVFDPGFAGEMVATRAGFFRDRGLDVEIRPGGFDADPIKLVASGSDTFGVTGADTFLLARAKGIPIVAFAAGYLQTPVVFYVHGESNIRSPKDFVGKRVGYQAGQDTATVYDGLLDTLNIDRTKVTEVPVRYDFTPFLTGEVDVWPGYAATQSYVLTSRHIPYRTISPSDYGMSYLGTVYFTNEDVMRTHPSIVQDFVDAVVHGWELTYSDTEAAIRMLQTYDPQTFTTDLLTWNLAKQKEFIRPKGMQFCHFTASQWETLKQTLEKQALLGSHLDMMTAVRYEFLDKHYSSNQK